MFLSKLNFGLFVFNVAITLTFAPWLSGIIATIAVVWFFTSKAFFHEKDNETKRTSH